MTAPTTPALDLVVEALEEAWHRGYVRNSTCGLPWSEREWATKHATEAARALLQKLSDHGAATFHCVCTLDAEGSLEPCKTHAQWAKSIAPPDAIRAAAGWKIEVARGKTVAVLYGDPEPEGAYPEDDPRSHNCDAMGCGSCGPHVLQIVPLHEATPHAARGFVTDMTWGDLDMRISEISRGEWDGKPTRTFYEEALLRLINRLRADAAALEQPR